MKDLKSEADVKKALASKTPVAIFFYMTTCPHCQVMHKPWEDLASESKGTEFVKAESSVVPSSLGITGFPHFVVAKGGKQVRVADGEMSKDDLKTKLLGGGGAGGRRVRRAQRRGSRRLTRRVVKVAHRTARVGVALR